jgi:hypothetical protein
VKTLALLLLAVAAAAQDEVATAREIRQREGYAKAIDYLEPRLDRPEALHAYVDCCLWGGEEERALGGIRAAKAPEADRLAAEIRLLGSLYRYREAAAAAERLVALGAYADWARGEGAYSVQQAALRERLAARASRGAWAAAFALAALLGLWAILRRAFRPSSARATA